MLHKLLLTTLILGSGYLFGQGLIIDHNCVNAEEIPSNIIDSVKQNIKFQWCGQSHSHQIPTGLAILESEFQNLDVTRGEVNLPQPNGTLCFMDGLIWEEYGSSCNGYWAYVGPKKYWSTDVAHGNIYQTLVECHPTINVSAFEWCGELSGVENDACPNGGDCSEYVLAYLDTMTVYEQMYPDVTFIYTTGHAQFNGINGYSRHQSNEIIRQYCIDNNKVLYDFGDLDCWSNGEFSYYLYEGDTIPIQHSDYDEDPDDPTQYYHTNALSCEIKGRATWWMLANLAGWEREISVNTKVYLEGPLNGSNMNTNLNTLGALPLSQPYNISPWYYNGTESVAAIPNANVVDWVLVELRDVLQSETPYVETTVSSRAGFLLNDGTIVDLDGSSPLTFNATISNNLHIVVRHKSHLDIVAANPASLTNDIYNYDFTTSANQVYGAAAGYKEITPGIWGMISGDSNADGTVNMKDKNNSWQYETGQNGYKAADFDLGGKVDNQDKNDNWLENINKQSQVPE